MCPTPVYAIPRPVKIVIALLVALVVADAAAQPATKTDPALATHGHAASIVEPPASAAVGNYLALERALVRYQTLEERGGWPIVPPRETLRLGDTLDAVATLRRRLAAEAYLPATRSDRPSIFDRDVDRAVRTFQEHHGLEVDGIVGRNTFAALNTPVEYRVDQIRLNLERWRRISDKLGARYVLVNIPGFRLDVIERDRRVLSMRAIVGTTRTRTPLFSTEITEVILAPYWYVPRSIQINEIEPKLARDPGYLARNGMVRLSSGVLRQEPGPRNPLGRLKFTVPNPYGVGLHDTPQRHLFDEPVCAFSHGCIRVEHPIELALYVLQDPAWPRERIEQAILTWRSRTIEVSEPIPMHVVYFTAAADESGRVWFYPDVYGYDDVRERSPEILNLGARDTELEPAITEYAAIERRKMTHR